MPGHNEKFIELFKSWRIIILLVLLLLAVVAIKPFPNPGVAIRYVAENSTFSLAGIQNPISPYPKDWEVIKKINDQTIKNIVDFYNVLDSLPNNATITIRTNKRFYALKIYNKSDLGIQVVDAPRSNIRFGLDISGGTRVILKPKQDIDMETLNKIISILNARLNVYGLSDVKITSAKDLDGNLYIVAEIAGATRDEVEDLLSKQGKFEAKIGNATVFTGGNDITYVCHSADCSRITCARYGNEYMCRFSFGLTISPQAAKRFAQATQNLGLNPNSTKYLDKPIVFYLDDKLYSSLQISSDLKGKAETQVSISGSGVGKTLAEARENARKEMLKLQTVLTVGSLPVKLEIQKIDEISPIFGTEFLRNAMLVGFLALLAVALVLFIRYRNPVVSLGIFLTMLSEVVLLLGFAAFTGWNLDLTAIAGIIVAVGTGVDDQIVITDEVLKEGLSKAKVSWKEKIKRAFFIIFGSYATTVVAMLPLLTAGVGLLKGFASTTIVGVTIGVFITRPAYAEYIKKMI